MATIGNNTLLIVGGTFDTAEGQTLQEITRPGTDGHAYAQMGKRAEPIQLMTFADFASAADARGEFSAYKSMQGSDPVDVTDDNGVGWGIFQVLKVTLAGPIQQVASPRGGLRSGAYILNAIWTLQGNLVQASAAPPSGQMETLQILDMAALPTEADVATAYTAPAYDWMPSTFGTVDDAVAFWHQLTGN